MANNFKNDLKAEARSLRGPALALMILISSIIAVGLAIPLGIEMLNKPQFIANVIGFYLILCSFLIVFVILRVYIRYIKRKNQKNIPPNKQ